MPARAGVSLNIVTMQNLFHDGGFSSMGMSLRAMDQYEKSFDLYRNPDGTIQYG